GNAGEGQYRSYAEVDIYHESDPTKVVWSGTQADVVGEGDKDAGEFLNKVRRDGFSKQWVPELGGKYTLKFYADPENHWAESNEDNNVHTLEIEVEDLRQKVKGRDATHGFGIGHHSVQDAPAHDAALVAAASEATASQTVQHDAKVVTLERSSDESVVFAQNARPASQVSSAHTAPEADSSDAPTDEWPESVDEVLSLRINFETLD
ncbi:MAG: CARDB domain-containing protein, partial [Bythopirellula sp.]